MPFDGSGNFQRVHNWVADAAAEIKIKADRHDAEDDNFAAGLSLAITRDGQSQIADDIPWNGRRILDLGNPVAPQDAATKAYVDTRTTFAPLVVTGNNSQGRISFTGSQSALATGFPLGLSFTQATLFFGVKPADVETNGRPARFVWNNSAAAAGTDVMELTRTGQLAIGRSVPPSSRSQLSIYEVTLQDVFLNSYYSNASSEILADLDGFAALLDFNRTTGTWSLLRSNASRLAGAAMSPHTVVFQVDADGNFKSTGMVFAGAASLTTTGDVKGTVWEAWTTGTEDSAFVAIGERIEARAKYWGEVAVREAFTDSRMSTEEISWDRGGSVVVGEKWENPGYVITGLEARPGDVVKYYARKPQLYSTTRGWVDAFKVPAVTP